MKELKEMRKKLSLLSHSSTQNFVFKDIVNVYMTILTGRELDFLTTIKDASLKTMTSMIDSFISEFDRPTIKEVIKENGVGSMFEFNDVSYVSTSLSTDDGERILFFELGKSKLCDLDMNLRVRRIF